MMKQRRLKAGLSISLTVGLMLLGFQNLSPIDTTCNAQSDVDPKLGNDKFYSFTHGGRTRSYIVHVSPNYKANVPTDVVFALHGGFGTACKIRETSLLNDLPERGGESRYPFITVYPNGVADEALYGDRGQHWNDGRVASLGNKIDDVGFLNAVIDRLSSAHGLNVNKRRVFAVGVSNGGMMMYRLARDSARFAGVTAISALMPKNFVTSGAPRLRAVPTLMISGTGDGRMPWAGGAIDSPIAGDVLSGDETFARLKAAIGNPRTTVDAYYQPYLSPGITRVDWAHQDNWSFGVRDRTRVELIKIYGGGHCWPGPQSEIAVDSGGACSQMVDGSMEAITFFLSQPDLRP